METPLGLWKTLVRMLPLVSGGSEDPSFPHWRGLGAVGWGCAVDGAVPGEMTFSGSQ